MVIAANQDTVFARLCGVMGREDLIDDVRFADHVARGEHQDDIDEIVGEWASQHGADELFERLTSAGVVSGPVNTVAEVATDGQFRARDMLIPHHDLAVGADVLGPGIVPKMTGTPGIVKWGGRPEPGYDNAAVYGEILGLGADDLDQLARTGVI